MILVIPICFQRSWKYTTRTQSKNGQISEGLGRREGARADMTRNIQINSSEQQRLAAGGHVHLLREPFQRNLTRLESARRTAAAFIVTERYKLLPASLLPALTGNTRAALTPTTTPRPLSSPAKSLRLGVERRAKAPRPVSRDPPPQPTDPTQPGARRNHISMSPR